MKPRSEFKNADEPNAVADSLDAEPLAGEHMRDVDALSVHADAVAGGDQDLTIVHGIAELRLPSGCCRLTEMLRRKC